MMRRHSTTSACALLITAACAIALFGVGGSVPAPAPSPAAEPVVRPIRRVEDIAQDLASGDLTVAATAREELAALPPGMYDEVARVAKDIKDPAIQQLLVQRASSMEQQSDLILLRASIENAKAPQTAPVPIIRPSKEPGRPLAQIAKDLGNPVFAVREAAQAEIDALPPSRVPELSQLLDAAKDPEVAARMHARVALVPSSYKLQFGGIGFGSYTIVNPSDFYQDDAAHAWGFDLAGKAKADYALANGRLSDSFIGSDKPFYFSVAVPEGNYRVTATTDGPTELTVRAELHRLMIDRFVVHPGEFRGISFVVNVRSPYYPGGKVSLKAPRETTDEAWAWDEKLTLEFCGEHPKVGSLAIEKVDVPTVYLVGDSTMCDQPKEPYNSWGQTFPRFFKDTIAIANHAESGETVAAALAAHRFDKVFSLLKKGDYLFFAFGHNDQKAGGVPLETYMADYRKIIQQTKAKGATPVVISSMERMNGIDADTLGEYPAAAQQVAAQEKVPFIDLHAMSKKLYRALGADLPHAFAVDNGKQDQTHASDFGSYEISKLILEGIRENHLDLVEHVRSDVPSFDPDHPDKFADFKLP